MIWANFHSLLLSLLFHFCYPLDSLSPIDGAKLSGLTFEAAIGNEHSISRLGSVTPANLRNILYGAEVGNKESLYFFGLLKLYGISVPRDEQVASDSFRKAGDLGHPEAATALGTMLSNGIGGRKDYSAAVTAFRTGIQLGDKNALWLLGKLLLEGSSHEAGVFGEIIIRDGVQAVEEAFHLFNLAADQHIPNAEHYLATMHEYGIGIPQDYSKALHFYQRSAEQGFLESMYHLSLMHVYGRGVPQDFKIALPLLEAAAREDHAPSCYYLGICKMYGYGCVLDYELAFNWFEKATSLNDFRVSAKAGEAAKGLRIQIDEANATNDRILQTLQQRSEIEAD